VRGLPCVDCQLLWWAALRCVVEPIQAQLRRRRGRATHAVAVDLSERHDCWRTIKVGRLEALEERKKVLRRSGGGFGFRFAFAR
jgi:hypothetical protein